MLFHVFFKVSRVSELPIAVRTSKPANENQEQYSLSYVFGGWQVAYTNFVAVFLTMFYGGC